MSEKYFTYKVDNQYKNLQHFVKEKLNLSLKQTKMILDKGACLLNGKVERFGSKKVKINDIVKISASYQSIDNSSLSNLVILYEDKYFLAVDKPVNFVCSDESIHKFFPKSYLLVHRLDKDVTGVLLIAKNKSIKDKFIDIFKNKQVDKTYVAIVDGLILKKHIEIESKIKKIKSQDNQSWYGPGKEGKYALTKLSLIKTKNNVSLVQLQPITGRTHQLRVHMKQISHPILGDYHYCKSFKYKGFVKRIMLHSLKIEFSHPITSKEIVIIAQYPKDFSAIIPN